MDQPSHPLEDADLHAFVDGQIGLQHRAAFIETLAADPHAQARVESWKRQNEALTATFGSILLEPVPLRLMPTSLGKDKRPAVRPDPRPPADRGQIVPIRQPPVRRTVSRACVAGVAIAAFSAGVLATYGVQRLGMAPGLSAGNHAVEAALPTGSSSLARRASEAHQAYAGHLNLLGDVPANEEGHRVAGIQRRLSVPVSIPDLRSLGWRLLGGRVLPGEPGPAAFLVYGRGTERLGLYMARSDAAQGDDLAVHGTAPALPNIAAWVSEPVGYALTADPGAAWFSRDAPALYQSLRKQAHDSEPAF